MIVAVTRSRVTVTRHTVSPTTCKISQLIRAQDKPSIVRRSIVPIDPWGKTLSGDWRIEGMMLKRTNFTQPVCM
jgi:hypothetical protein